MRIGLALGAGGANGFAHILMLEVFEALGLRPARISGASVGAVIGGLYASGRSAAEIDAIAGELAVRDSRSWRELLLERKLLRWLELFDPAIGRGALVSSRAFVNALYGQRMPERFEDLRIPLSVVATDFWGRGQVVLEQGLLLPAVQASMALPGVFTPVEIDGRLLVDGGMVNPLPYDLLQADCDLTVAINVTGKRSPKAALSFVDSLLNTFQIMQSAIIAEKRRYREPDIYIEPDIVDVRALEVGRRDTVYAQSRPARDELKRRLAEAVESRIRGGHSALPASDTGRG